MAAAMICAAMIIGGRLHDARYDVHRRAKWRPLPVALIIGGCRGIEVQSNSFPMDDVPFTGGRIPGYEIYIRIVYPSIPLFRPGPMSPAPASSRSAVDLQKRSTAALYPKTRKYVLQGVCMSHCGYSLHNLHVSDCSETRKLDSQPHKHRPAPKYKSVCSQRSDFAPPCCSVSGSVNHALGRNSQCMYPLLTIPIAIPRVPTCPISCIYHVLTDSPKGHR